MGRQIVDKCGVIARQIGRLDVVREKFEREGRANVVLVAAPRIAFHFLDRMLAGAKLAVLHRPESFDPVVEQIVQPPAETFGLLVSEIAKVKARIL